MANAFAPEVGIDIGASNVTPGSARSIDFSGLSNIFGSGTGSKPTETEIQNELLAPFVNDLTLISQVPNPIQRETYFRQAEIGAQQAYPGLSDEIGRITDRFKKNTEPVPGTTRSLVEVTYNDFLKTDAGKAAAYVAAQSNKNPDGTIDDMAAYQEVATKAFDYFRTQEEYNRLKTQVETKKFTAEQAFTSFVPTRAAEVNGLYDDMFKNSAIIRAGFAVTGTTEDTARAKLMLENWVATEKAKDTQRLAALGVDVNDAKFSLNPIYSVVESKIKTLETVLSTPEFLGQQVSEEARANTILRINKAGRPELTAAFASKEGESAYWAARVNDLKTDIEKAADTDQAKAVEEALVMRTVLDPVAVATGSEPMTPPVPANSSDLSRSQAAIAFAEFDPKQVNSFLKLPTEEQAASLNTALNMFSIITPDKISNATSATAFRKTEFSEAFLGLSARSPFNYVDNAKMQKYYGNSTFEVAKKISSLAPAEGTLMYKQMNKAMATEVERIKIRLFQNLTSMQFPEDKNPLVFKEVNNRIVIGLNPDAVANDPDLQMEMRSIQAARQIEEMQGSTFVLDPHFETREAEQFVRRYNSMIFSKGSDMLDIMRNLNLLNTQFDKMPDEIKNDPAFGKITIRSMLSAIPTYVMENRERQ